MAFDLSRLDSQVQAFLQAQAAAAPDLPPIREQSVEMARALYEALGALLGDGAPVEVENRSFPGPAGEVPIRIYRPSSEEIHPVLIYYHGGGWVIGSLDTHDHACRALCEGSGCAVVSVDYRLAPEHPFPAAVDDSYGALEWVAANSEALGVDVKRLAVGGDSAGGNLAAVVSQLARDRGGPEISFQLLIYPGVDAATQHPSVEENAEAPILTRDHMIWFRDHYLQGADLGRDPRVSPIRADSLEGLPPALVQTAECDPLRDEGMAYGEALRNAGVETTVTNYDGMVHAFFQLSPILDAGRRAVEEACSALRSALGGGGSPRL